MTDRFGGLIKAIHSSAKIQDDEIKANGEGSNYNYITINEKRQFIPGDTFDTVIAYEGDINSQLITFRCVKSLDGHNLNECNYHKLRWKNLSSGAEGVSILTVVSDGDNKYFPLIWEVPSEACTQAGTIEISISIYDIDESAVVFSWNTASYSGLTVAPSMSEVNYETPAKNEILIIDRDTRNIIAPNGYNNTICNYGEIGVGEIYFLVNRYLGKRKEIDVLEDATISIYIAMNDNFGCDTSDTGRISKTKYTLDKSIDYKDGLVLITWEVPPSITAGTNGPNNFSIMVSFEKKVEGNLQYKWNSNTYTSLNIGDSLYQVEGDAENWNLMDDYINIQIENFLEEHNFIIDAN